jgi:hypothetical protein
MNPLEVTLLDPCIDNPVRHGFSVLYGTINKKRKILLLLLYGVAATQLVQQRSSIADNDITLIKNPKWFNGRNLSGQNITNCPLRITQLKNHLSFTCPELVKIT